jgi:hypothetical protein
MDKLLNQLGIRPYRPNLPYGKSEDVPPNLAPDVFAHIIPYEGQDRDISVIDSNGLPSRGVEMFQDAPWSDISHLSGMEGSSTDPVASVQMMMWAVEDGYLSRWTCSRLPYLVLPDTAGEEQDRRRDRFASALLISASIIAAVRLALGDISWPSPRLSFVFADSVALTPQILERGYADIMKITAEWRIFDPADRPIRGNDDSLYKARSLLTLPYSRLCSPIPAHLAGTRKRRSNSAREPRCSSRESNHDVSSRCSCRPKGPDPFRRLSW